MRAALTIVLLPILMFLSPDHCNAQDAQSKRQELVYRSLKTNLALLHTVKMSTNVADARSNAGALVQRTDELFIRLNDQNLLDNKMKAYEMQWRRLAPILVNNPQSAGVQAKMVMLFENIGYAAKGDKATVNVASSKGSGASVKYAKEVDANSGRFQDWGDPTTTSYKELERGNYVFKLFRGDRETGQTGPVACTDTEKPKTVTVQEQ